MIEQGRDAERTLASPPQPGIPDALALSRFDFELPPERIAQRPAERREDARLLVLERSSGALGHRGVSDLPALLAPGDLLVVNTTRVLPARLRGRKPTGGAVEALLLGAESARPRHYRALVKLSGRLRPGLRFAFGPEPGAHEAEVVALGERGEVVLCFSDDRSPYDVGEAPLPPYIQRSTECPEEFTLDVERYQTVFADVSGAIAAPTAGLHLTQALLSELASRGVEVAEVVLHVGLGTFRPLQASDLAAGRLHSERFALPQQTADAVARTRARAGRVVAVGTTTTRVLESCALGGGEVGASMGQTELFLYPGCEFRVVDALLTNFHLPRSSLLYLVAAFAGRDRVLESYRAAIDGGYRFYSYGDAMLIL